MRRFLAIEPLHLLQKLIHGMSNLNGSIMYPYFRFKIAFQLFGGIKGCFKFLGLLFSLFPTPCFRADLPRVAVAINVQVLDAPASSPVRLTVLWTPGFMTGVDGHGFAGAAYRNKSKFTNRLVRQFDHVKHFPFLG